MTATQAALIDRSRKAITYHRGLAEDCNKAGLPILAREHDYIAQLITEKVELQIRAFRDDALAGEKI